MKVLHVTNNYPTSKYPIFGIFVKEQIDSLTRQGVENEIFFINGRENGKKEYLKAIWRIRKKIEQGNFDIIHCHHVFSAIVLLLTFRFFDHKCVVSYQNPPKREGGMFIYKLINIFFNAIIVKNSSILINNKVFYLPNGVNLDFFKDYSYEESIEKLKLNDKKKYILFMDSFKRRSQKRIDRFNAVIEILKKGGNPYNIESLILTNTERSLIPYYMSVSSLHLLTSDFEGSPNSVKECLACNTPVVSTPVGNVQDLIGDVEGCFISKSFDTNELAGLVINSLDINNFQGRDKIITKNLDIITVAKELTKIYIKIINGNNEIS
jgi:teichuronic acid biosynthesis glycosyltransferase TuaC